MFFYTIKKVLWSLMARCELLGARRATVNNNKEMHKLWVNHFNSRAMQGKDTKQFYNEEETKRFSDNTLAIINDLPEAVGESNKARCLLTAWCTASI